MSHIDIDYPKINTSRIDMQFRDLIYLFHWIGLEILRSNQKKVKAITILMKVMIMK